MEDSINTINSIDSGKFARLLSRISESFDKETSEVFTAKEKEKLAAMFSISTENLESANKTCKTILEEIAYDNISEHAIICKNLKAKYEELSDEKLMIFAECWNKYSDNIVTSLKQQPSIFNRLKEVNYNVCEELGQSNVHNRNVKLATLQLQLTSANEHDEYVSMQCNKEDLYSIYEKMEKIQEVLDKLA